MNVCFPVSVKDPEVSEYEEVTSTEEIEGDAFLIGRSRRAS